MNIYDIARLAGVSPSTVSKVINGRTEIGEETKSRIQAIIQQYGYVPKISANTPTNIGVFTHLDNLFTSSYLNELLAGISEYFFPRDFGLLMLPAEQTHLDRKRFQVFCHKQRLAGGVFLDLVYDEGYVEQIAGVVPLVTINAEFQGEDLYAVMSDDYKGCTQAVEYLVSMGHRRIAFGTIGLNHFSHKLRMQAYKDVLTKHGIPIDNRLIFLVTRDFETIYDNWDDMNIMPTAIVALNDQEALKIMSFLQSRNREVPRDMSIVGFDNYSFAEHLSPQLTTVRQPLHDVSKQAATILYERILHSNRQFDRKYMFEEELIVRRSVADIRNTEAAAHWTPRAIGE